MEEKYGITKKVCSFRTFYRISWMGIAGFAFAKLSRFPSPLLWRTAFGTKRESIHT